MRERRYVKLKVDMYEDTKFKIIDTKPERDTIFYIWSRLVLLAGKVNLGGELYLSNSIPYTIETLAIEFNRGIAQVKLALDTFMELEMLQLTEDNVYKVKNFAKHQNIKVKEKEIPNNKEAKINTAIALSENSELEIINDKNKELENKLIEKNVVTTAANLEVTNKNKAATMPDASIENILKDDNLQNNNTVLLYTKKNSKRNRNTKDNLIDINSKDEEILDEEVIDDDVCSFTDGDITLGKDESVVAAWSFG